MGERNVAQRRDRVPLGCQARDGSPLVVVRAPIREPRARQRSGHARPSMGRRRVAPASNLHPCRLRASMRTARHRAAPRHPALAVVVMIRVSPQRGCLCARRVGLEDDCGHVRVEIVLSARWKPRIARGYLATISPYVLLIGVALIVSQTP